MEAVKRDDWIVVGLSGLLLIDVLFLPWVSYGPYSATATDAPDGWTGILAVLVLIALIADLLLERLSPGTTLPNFGGSRTVTRFRLAIIAAVFIGLKLLFHISFTFSYLGFGFVVAVVVGVGLVYATLRVSQDKPLLNS